MRAARSLTRSSTVVRVSQTASNTCNNMATPRAINTGRNKRLCSRENKAPPLQNQTTDTHESTATGETVIARTTKGRLWRPFVAQLMAIRQTDDAARWSRYGPGQWK